MCGGGTSYLRRFVFLFAEKLSSSGQVNSCSTMSCISVLELWAALFLITRLAFFELFLVNKKHDVFVIIDSFCMCIMVFIAVSSFFNYGIFHLGNIC